MKDDFYSNTKKILIHRTHNEIKYCIFVLHEHLFSEKSDKFFHSITLLGHFWSGDKSQMVADLTGVNNS